MVGRTEQRVAAYLVTVPKNTRPQRSVKELVDVCGKALEKRAPEVAFMACQCHDKIREDLIVVLYSPHSHSLSPQMLAKMLW